MASERHAKPKASPGVSVADGEGPDWRTLRLWHIQPVRDILVLAMVFGVLYIGYVLSPITVPMLLALLLSYLFEPVVQWLTRSRRIRRPGAALIIIAGFFIAVIAPLGIGLGVGVAQAVRLVETVGSNSNKLVSAVTGEELEAREAAYNDLPPAWQRLVQELNTYRDLIPQLKQEAERRKAEAERRKAETEKEKSAPPGNPPKTEEAPAPNVAEKGDQKVTGDGLKDEAGSKASTTPVHLSPFKQRLFGAIYAGIAWVRANADNLAKSIGQQALATGQGAIAMMVAMVGGLAFLAFSAFLTAFFFFFFCTGWGKVLDFWANLIPERKKGRAFDLIAKMDRVIAGFVRGRLTICAIMMLVFTLAYWFIGVPMPFLVGPLVGLLFIVPFLHILSIPLGIILLWLQPSSLAWQNTWWWILFAPIGVDLLGQFLDDWVLSPVIQGKTTNMDTPTILFASMAGGTLAGLYGLLVAIPVAACIRILVMELFWPKFRRWARGEERDFLPIASDDSAPAAPGKK
jgi:predicted PurR-regulated permease PerM